MKNNRIKNYLKQAEKQSLTVLFSGLSPQKSADQNYPFVVNRNFYYLTNIDQEESILLIVNSVNPQAYLFIEKRSLEKMLWDGPVLTFEEASVLSNIPLTNIFDKNNFETFLNQLLSGSRKALHGNLTSLNLDLDYQARFPKPLSIDYANVINTKYPHLTINNINMVLASLRQVKDANEVENITKAINITNLGLQRIMKHLKPGLKEFEMENEFNYVLGKHQQKTSFDTIAASGVNATILHYVNNNDTLKENELMLFDLGNYYNNYASDISRTYPISGKFTNRQKEIYEVVLEANKETIKWLKPGVTMAEFNEFGKNILIKGAMRLGLITEESQITNYYYHSLGHYLGLDVHDVGDYTKVIEEGNILTIEPGLYIKEEGIGIRIEDNVLITKDGAINLSKDIIKEVNDIEAFMKK